MADRSEMERVVWKASSLAFSSRYRKLQLSSEIPSFYVLFLGQCDVDKQGEVKKASYRTKLVSEICENMHRQKRRPRKVELSISWHGIEIIDQKTGSEELVPIFLINRGMTDVERPRIFGFISQNASTKRLECFAFAASKIKTSWAMTLSLKRSFEVAYETWKMEQKEKNRFHDNRLLELAEDLLKNRIDVDEEGEKGEPGTGNAEDEQMYSPRTTWTKFEEDLMVFPSKRFSLKRSGTGQRRMPSIREVVGQPAVDRMFRMRQQDLLSQASVFDVGDNEGLRKAAEDEEVQILSLTGMDEKARDSSDFGNLI